MTTAKKQLLTQAEYARLRGVTPARVNHLVKDGVIALVDGLVNPVQADAAIFENSDPSRDEYRKFRKFGRPISDGEESAYRKAATEEKYWRAKIAEFEAGKLKEALVDAEDVKAVFSKHITAVKTRLRSIPSKCAQEVAQMKMPMESDRELMARVQLILARVVDEALTEIAGWKPHGAEIKQIQRKKTFQNGDEK